jgi:hypothetical protein
MGKVEEYFEKRKALEELKQEAVNELKAKRKEIDDQMGLIGEKSSRSRMTRYERWDIVISAIGLIAIGFLIYQTGIMREQTKTMVAQTENMTLQTQQLTESIEMTALANIQNRDFEVNKILYENPNLQPYFYDKKPIAESDKNYNKVAALAGLRLDALGAFYDYSGYIREFRNPNNPAWEAWIRYIKDVFAKSPIMCKNLNNVKSYYTEEFVRFVGQGCPPANETPSLISSRAARVSQGRRVRRKRAVQRKSIR